MRWTQDSIPNQEGRVVLVTGANSGIGLEAARALARKGAHVVMACRSADKAKAALDDVEASVPGARTEFLPLDLSDLGSVRRAASDFLARHERLDILLNNAGVMFTARERTADGFELQLGTNHLGHFALTGCVLEALERSPDARVVTVSSTGHRPGRMDFDDLQWGRRYDRFAAYFRSKLANLLFTHELERRLEAAGRRAIAVAAHPGASATNLGHIERGQPLWWLERTLRPIVGLLAQDAAMGALPSLRAATDPDVEGGDYFGPDGFMEARGHPVRVSCSRRARDGEDARKLWEASERLTGVVYGLGA